MIIIPKALFTSVTYIMFAIAIGFTVYMPVSLADNVIAASISKGGINRISAFPYHIKEIIGDKSKYEFLASDDGSNIFIMPKVKLGDQLELAVITSNGVIHDLLLKVQRDSVPAIHLHSSRKQQSRDLLQNKVNKQVQILKMIGDMSSNHQGSYYVQDVNRNIANNLGLKLKQVQTWRFGNLVGAVLNIHNISCNTKSLTENDFKFLFKGAKAISILGGNILPPKTSSLVVVVTG